MRIAKEYQSYEQFPFSKKALEKLADLTVEEKRQIWQYLEDTAPDAGYMAEDIEDFILYDDDYVAELLGYEDWETLYKIRNATDTLDALKGV